MKLTPFLLVLPAVGYIVAFSFFPTVDAVYLSFQDPHGGLSLHNYQELTYFNIGGAVLDTVLVTVGALLIQLALGFLVASVLSREFFGKKALSTITIIPMGVATVVAAITFSFIFQTSGGYANTIIHSLFGTNVNWYQTSLSSLIVVMLADSWKNTPIVSLILLAGMSSIPRELYYSAAIDGAGPFRRFVHITLPNLRSFIGVALILRGVQEFNIFALPLILIGDHPPLLTTLVYNLYTTTFPEVGLALAAATVLLGFILVFMGVVIKLTGGRST
ncbi:Trehalose/maltose transport system permease protein MalF [Metallosphaera sp. J1]|uniref:carbohydrate ABC transporter permease n=1 Tax=Metallosphaera TaxID=41980 RepID=UPI002106F800|nr:sugar ABC transporter permease [Metallosphaera javensis (ex Hofmann et al. 2022)]MCG3109986.1 Trehalose/maltose transport system permease protein MalF [Metallosphaera javensis (ex Hofmann et al. 2022)]BCS93734.1 MAG: trehalose/maltose transport system permease protein MalF [Metallosphaera javensis (ex Sakai et al. 2022)]